MQPLINYLVCLEFKLVTYIISPWNYKGSSVSEKNAGTNHISVKQNTYRKLAISPKVYKM